MSIEEAHKKFEKDVIPKELEKMKKTVKYQSRQIQKRKKEPTTTEIKIDYKSPKVYIEKLE